MLDLELRDALIGEADRGGLHDGVRVSDGNRDRDAYVGRVGVGCQMHIDAVEGEIGRLVPGGHRRERDAGEIDAGEGERPDNVQRHRWALDLQCHLVVHAFFRAADEVGVDHDLVGSRGAAPGVEVQLVVLVVREQDRRAGRNLRRE